MKLLSIVIPTRNRDIYCISAIKEILAYERRDFELCICDNSDTDGVEEYINAHPDDRVVYQHIRPRINSAINMDTAMRMATGEYVCMIGDDDAILPNIFNVAEWAKQNNYDNVTPVYMIDYYWPGAKEETGVLKYPEVQNDNFKIVDAKAQLKTFLMKGGIRYYEFLPRVYHGLVKKEILGSIQKKTGHIIGGLSPDIYMAVAVSCIIDHYTTVPVSFTIPGACPRSYSGLDLKGKIDLSLESNPQFYKRGPYTWDERIPKMTTSQTIWGETALKSLEEIGRQDLIKYFNQGYFFAYLAFANRNYLKFALNKIMETKPVKSNVASILNFFKCLITKMISRKFKMNIEFTEISNTKDMDEAIEKIKAKWPTKEVMYSLS